MEEFGSDILLADGSLDRSLLASRAFASQRATRHLNEITHPAIRELAEAELAESEANGGIVVYEMPLLVETGQVSLVDLVVVVDLPEDMQLQRATARGLSEADTRARMAQQVSRERRLEAADHIVANDRDIDTTRAQVDALWEEWTHA